MLVMLDVAEVVLEKVVLAEVVLEEVEVELLVTDAVVVELAVEDEDLQSIWLRAECCIVLRSP